MKEIVFSVCPTYVGMNRNIPHIIEKEGRMPHVCGDEPGGR